MSIDGDSIRFQQDIADRIAKAFAEGPATSINPAELFRLAGEYIDAERCMADVWLNGANAASTGEMFRCLTAAEDAFEAEFAEQFPNIREGA